MHAYATSSSRTRVGIMLAAIAIPVSVLVNLLPLPASSGWVYSISYPTVLGLFIWAFRDRAWATSAVQFLPESVPDIAGVYEGTLESSWKADPDDDPTTMDIRIEIVQNWLRLRLYFEVRGERTSTAESTTAALDDHGGGTSVLTYTFHNRPEKPTADPDMHPHDGTARLRFDNGKVTGTYYNARRREGTMRLRRVSRGRP